MLLDDLDKRILDLLENHPLNLSLEGIIFVYTNMYEYTNTEDIKTSLKKLISLGLLIKKGTYYGLLTKQKEITN